MSQGSRGRRAAVVGIDAGTSVVKAVVLGHDGAQLGIGRVPVAVAHGSSGRSEQDMDAVWEAVAEAVREGLAQAAAAAGDVGVTAVGVTGQGDGAWLVDGGGRPCGPAVLWSDGRAAARGAAWEEDGRAKLLREMTGSMLFPGLLPVLLEELAVSSPSRVAGAAYHLNCKDWIRFRLTGEIATDASEASRTYGALGGAGYSRTLLEGLGHERFRPLLPGVLGPGEAAGRVTEEAGRATGLPAGVPVATGMLDSAAAGIGLGALEPGDGFAVIGTTAFVGRVHASAGAGAGADRTSNSLALGLGRSVLECLSSMTGAPNLDWARATLGVSLDAAEELAAAVPPGAGGVRYLPYGSPSGERAPFVDPAASAAWLGLDVRTSPGQLLRAVYEGLACAIRECLDALGAGSTLRLAGGVAGSALLCQVIADVTGRTVLPSAAAEPGARGVAALGLAAAGWRLGDAAEALGGRMGAVAPDPGRREGYERQYAGFVSVRDAVRPHWPELRAAR
ncbi:FGGY family carbohydrate kinase [Streptomyces boninensis]|uniref:FGGY family carbohydrate kinase n=1 Tax=Streptomyces boninensis TaxID=2039455 RepID=UPI003B219D05